MPLRKAQQTPLQAHQPPVDTVKLIDQCLDPVVGQMDIIHQLDHFQFQLLIFLFLRAGDNFVFQRRRQAGFLQLVQLLVGLGDFIEALENLGLQCFLKGGKRHGVAFGIILILFLILLAVGFAFFLVALVILIIRIGIGLLVIGEACGGQLVILAVLAEAFLQRLFRCRARAIGGIQVNDIAQQQLFLQHQLAPVEDGADGQRTFADGADQLAPARLDPFGDGNLAFAREQLHRAHFAQIHAHRIIGTVPGADGRFLGDLAAGPLLRLIVAVIVVAVIGRGIIAPLLVILNNIDAHFREQRHGVLDLFRRHLILRQNRVQLVERHIALVFRFREHLLDGCLGGINKGAVRAFIALV